MVTLRAIGYILDRLVSGEVLFVPSWFPTPHNPVWGTFIERQVRLVAAHHPVAVLAIGDDWRRYLKRRRLPPIGRRRRDAGGWTARVASPPGLWNWRPSLVVLLRQADWAYRGLARAGVAPRLIHAHATFPGGLVAQRLASRLGVPYVLTEHFSGIERVLRGPHGPSVEHALRCAAQVIAVSHHFGDRLRAAVPGLAPSIVPNVVDVPSHVTAAPTEPRLLAVGTLRRIKGMDVLLEATARLAATVPDLSLHIVGDGPERTSLEVRANRADLRGRVRFLGQQPRAIVEAEMRDCAVFVTPSRSETFGVAPLEAAALGRPVVATRCGGPEETITSALGRLVAPEDPGALAAAIDEVLRHADDFDPMRMAENVRRRFGPDAVWDKLDEVYRNVA